MAIRIHVTAVRDCPAEEVRAVFTEVLGSGFEQVEVREHGGWAWFTTSVWFVKITDLNKGICRLARPGLQFSTSDGDRWYLTVHGGPQGQHHFLHEFGYHSYLPGPEADAEYADRLAEQSAPLPVDPKLAFLENDPIPADGPPRPKAPFDLVAESLAEMGAAVPESFRAEVADLPYSGAMARYREWHVAQVAEALAAARIPDDPAALHAVLTWENVSAGEGDSDLGNLPRLLSILGLGGDWDEWVRQAESPPEPPQEPVPAPEPPPPEEYIRPVRDAVDPLGLAPVDGGPVPLPLRQLRRIAFCSEACSKFAAPGVALAVELPAGIDGGTVVLPKKPTGYGEAVATLDGFAAGVMNSMWLGTDDMRRLLGKPLARLLRHLPDGAALDVALAVEDEPPTYQRYRGRVEGEAWLIDAAHPPVSAEALADALALAGGVSGTRYAARDAAEVDAILAAARADSSLHDAKIDRRGLRLRCESDLAGNLAKLFFRHRWRRYWDVGPVEAHEAAETAEARELARRMRRAGVESARRRAAPHDEAVLFRGEQGRYWRSDIAQLTELEPEPCEEFDAALRERGFEHVGDLVAKKQRDIVLGIWASSDRLVYGILMTKRTLYLGWEFYSRFTDGSTLTTTTNASIASHPEVGIYFKECPGLDTAALCEKHRWGMERFRTRKGVEPESLSNTLEGVAREIDRAAARRAAAGE